MCSNEARVENLMKLINLNVNISKEFPKYNHYYRKNVICIALRFTHEPFKSVRELGLPKTEIKVRNYYIFQSKFTWKKNHQIYFAMLLDKTLIKHCLFKISLTIVHI